MIWVRRLALVLSSGVVAFQGFLLYNLLRAHGRALLRHEELSERVAQVEATLAEVTHLSLAAQPSSHAGLDESGSQVPEGLPRGSPAPDFTLPDLEGRQRILREFLGKPLLVVFFSPRCGFCRQLAPRLGHLPENGPRVLVISHGEPEEHRRLAQEHGWMCDVVLQQDWEASIAWRAHGTPTGYLLDPRGHIGSDLIIGTDDLLSLLEAMSGTSKPG